MTSTAVEADNVGLWVGAIRMLRMLPRGDDTRAGQGSATFQ